MTMTITKTKKYYADSKGDYDIRGVMADIKNGVQRIEIDFSAYMDKILEGLREQEKYYKK